MMASELLKHSSNVLESWDRPSSARTIARLARSTKGYQLVWVRLRLRADDEPAGQRLANAELHAPRGEPNQPAKQHRTTIFESAAIARTTHHHQRHRMP